MSEYQYLEWQTVDRPLTERQMAEVNRLSSHMEVVTATQAIVTYSWGDFKHDPQRVLLDYFDAFLYLTNWGSHHLMFRFPKDTIDPAAIQPYCLEERITLTKEGQYYVLAMTEEDEEGFEWVDGEGQLGKLIPLREQIIQGDYRALYLAWLGLSYPDEDDVPEPPVPPELRKLNASLHAEIDFFGVDPHLVKAAADASPEPASMSDETLRSALTQLSRAECEDFLLRVLNNEPQVASTLRKRLIDLAGVEPHPAAQSKRTHSELNYTAERIRETAERKAKAEAERKHIADLNELAKKEEATWQKIFRLVEEKQARSYDEAVDLLLRLRELAEYQQRMRQFEQRMAEIHDRYAKSQGLMRRFRESGLVYSS